MPFATEPNPTDPATDRPAALARPAHLDQKLVAKINEHKAGLLAQFNHESELSLHLARLAINEAESLAWSTPYAHFFLPALVEEKIQCARQWANRRSRVGNGLPAVTTSHEVIRCNELVGIPQDTLATGRVPRSSGAASRAFEVAHSDTCR